MTVENLEKLWAQAIYEILGESFDSLKLNVLAKQTYDSIRRIQVYNAYGLKADEAAYKKLPFSYTSNPFILAQRSELNIQNKVWIIYLATYFGKSNKSKWELFNRAVFKKDQSFINFDQIKTDLNNYFNYLSSVDFFEKCTYSNHRKFTAKSLIGDKGLFKSIEYFVTNIELYCPENEMDFHDMYKLSLKIPNFGRLAAFDFTSSLAKLKLNIKEPKSMYAEHSTGPLKALELLLNLTNKQISKASKKQLESDIMEWFNSNTKIFMVGQVLEDAICNWQKNTLKYVSYSG